MKAKIEIYFDRHCESHWISTWSYGGQHPSFIIEAIQGVLQVAQDGYSTDYNKFVFGLFHILNDRPCSNVNFVYKFYIVERELDCYDVFSNIEHASKIIFTLNLIGINVKFDMDGVPEIKIIKGELNGSQN